MPKQTVNIFVNESGKMVTSVKKIPDEKIDKFPISVSSNLVPFQNSS